MRVGFVLLLTLVVFPEQSGVYPAIWRCFDLSCGARFWDEAVWSSLSVYREDTRAKREGVV